MTLKFSTFYSYPWWTLAIINNAWHYYAWNYWWDTSRVCKTLRNVAVTLKTPCPLVHH